MVGVSAGFVCYGGCAHVLDPDLHRIGRAERLQHRIGMHTHILGMHDVFNMTECPLAQLSAPSVGALLLLSPIQEPVSRADRSHHPAEKPTMIRTVTLAFSIYIALSVAVNGAQEREALCTLPRGIRPVVTVSGFGSGRLYDTNTAPFTQVFS